MKYPNAFIGVKRLFSSRIMALIGGFAMLISAFMALVLITIPDNPTGGEAAAGGLFAILALVFMLVSCVMLVVSFILGITGLSKASIDEPAFRIALFATVVNIIFVGFGSIFSSLHNDMMASLMNSLSTIADLFTFIYTIQGIRSLALQLGDEDMDRRGNNLFKALLSVIVLEFIANIIVTIFYGVKAAAAIAGIIACIAAVLTVIQYILFLVYLAKAKKMLANAQ